MTFWHLLVLGIGAVVAIVLADLLSHRQHGAWPLGLLVPVLVVAAGLLYSPWLAALALGFALGTSIALVAEMVRTISRSRREKHHQRDRRRTELARRLDEGPRD